MPEEEGFRSTMFQHSATLPAYSRQSQLARSNSQPSSLVKEESPTFSPSDQSYDMEGSFFSGNGRNLNTNPDTRINMAMIGPNGNQNGNRNASQNMNQSINQPPSIDIGNQSIHKNHGTGRSDMAHTINEQRIMQLRHNATNPTNGNYVQNTSSQNEQPNTVSSTSSGLENRRTNFLSSAADLEYSTLSSILQDNFMALNPNLATSTEGTPNSMHSPALSPHGVGMHKINSPSSLATTSFGASKPSPTSRLEFPHCDTRINQYFLQSPDLKFPTVVQAIEQLRQTHPEVYYERNADLALSFAISTEEVDADNGLQFNEPEEIYAKITRPFSYTPGFHRMIAYLRRRFPREMLVKMAESMASYRPSFIACTTSLREADLIFMEQCFQRTLLTYDNVLKVSGTPTVVWRRTGEIAYVGTEFCILTGWSKELLLGERRTFIVELLDDKLVVEYFQLFLRIAFGDFLGATMTECTLLTPTKDVKIRTGCMWTLKRDVFGIPMMIIGNFLPIV